MIAFEEGLASVPEDLPGIQAGPLMCAGLTTFNSLRNSGAGPGDIVAVQGMGGLGTNGKLVLIAQTEEPIEVNSLQLLVGRKSILGWYSGYAKDSEETLAFSRLTGVKAMVEAYPFEKVNEAFDKMMNGKPRFKVALRMGR